MKNQFILFVFSLISLISFGQKKYSFNYKIEYEFQREDSTKVEKTYFFTNSEDNTYFLKATEVDSGYVNIDFYDIKGIRSMSSMKNEAFFKSENVILKCDFVKSQNEEARNHYERYIFSVNHDTIIENTLFKKHKLSYSSKKDSKKYNKGSANYIIEPNTDFHKPLLAFSFSFDVILRNESMGNGIAKEIFTTSYKQNKKKFTFKLIGYSKIEKSLTIPKECSSIN